MTEEMDLIEKANAAAARLEEANKEMAELVARQERIDARRLLGGQSEAGKPSEPVVSQEEKDKADMKNYFKGSAIEGAFK